MPAKINKVQKTEAAALLPTSFRTQYERVSVCVDVKFKPATLKALQGTFDADDELYLAVSSKADPEVALTAHSVRGKRSTLHVTVEFRRNMEAPYPKLTQAKMSNLVDHLRAGRDFTLRHAEVTYLPTLPTPPVPTLAAPNLRVTGFTYEIVPDSTQEEPKKGSRVRFKKSGEVELTNWLRTEVSVQSFEEAIVLGIREALKQGGKDE